MLKTVIVHLSCYIKYHSFKTMEIHFSILEAEKSKKTSKDSVSAEGAYSS